MFYIRLFTNKTAWQSLNEIQELECEGYTPIKLTNMDKLLTQGISFQLQGSADVYGCYVTTSEGDLIFHQRFNESPFIVPDFGGTISVEFSK